MVIARPRTTTKTVVLQLTLTTNQTTQTLTLVRRPLHLELN